MTYRHWLTSIVIGALILLALAACTSSPPQPPPGPSTLEVQPPEGPPGTFITITGLSSEALARDDLAVIIGGVQMPASVEEDGSLTSVLPPFVGASGWHEPTGPLDVVV